MPPEKEGVAWQGDPSTRTRRASLPAYPRPGQGELLDRLARQAEIISDLEADRTRLAALNAALAVELVELEAGR